MNDITPLGTAEAQSKDNKVAKLLMHDAVYSHPDLPTFTYKKDAETRGIIGRYCVDYKRIVEMLFEYDKVVSW